MTHDEFINALPELVSNYRPSPEALQHISAVTLVMLIGPSAAGKTTLIDNMDVQFVPSDTTREPRPGELNGVDYFFRTDYDQVVSELKSGQFVQVAPFATGELYATRSSSYPQSGTAIMSVMAGVVPVFRSLGFQKTISVFITPPTYEEWMRRLSMEPNSVEQRSRRLSEAHRSFAFALADDETHFVMCDDIATAVAQLKSLLNDGNDSEQETKARRTAEALFATLKEDRIIF